MASEELTRKLQRALLKKAKELERFHDEQAKAILTPQEFEDCKRIIDKLGDRLIEKIKEGISRGTFNEPTLEEFLDKEELARLRKYFAKGDEWAKRRLSYIR